MPKIGHQRTYRTTRFIHEGLRFDPKFFTLQEKLCHLTKAKSRLFKGCLVLLCQRIHYHKANIVFGFFIFFAGISQATTIIFIFELRSIISSFKLILHLFYRFLIQTQNTGHTKCFSVLLRPGNYNTKWTVMVASSCSVLSFLTNLNKTLVYFLFDVITKKAFTTETVIFCVILLCKSHDKYTLKMVG